MTIDTSPRAIADAYLAVWNEAARDTRAQLTERGWSAEVTYRDPLMEGTTPAGIVEMIEAARAQAPGFAFMLRGIPSGHHDVVRFSWDLKSVDGALAAAGTDIVRLDQHGRIAEVIGFLD